MRAILASVVLGALLPALAAAQSVTIDKVEPPNWWVDMPWRPVQLMLYGDHLHGITARFDDERLRVTGVHTLTNPSYAFVDVDIQPDLPPGTYTLTVQSGASEASIAYPIEARAPRDGRHQGFDADDVVYLITPDRFANGDPSNDRVEGIMDEFDRSQPGMRHGGDLQGLIDHLDYLQDLGVTALWLNPVLENSGRNSYHGYAATDLYRIDPRFGTNEDYKRFVEEAHRRDLKVIFDHVNNHIGIRHPWIDNLPAPSWLNGSVEDHLVDKHYKMAVSDPHADPYSADQLRTFWFVNAMPDLNQRDPFLATYRIQNTLWWIEYTGLDGIREDTYPYVDQAFLTRWADVILTAYPSFNIVGEIWETAPAYLALFQEGSPLPNRIETNLPVVMDFALSEALRAYLSGEGKLSGVYNVIAQDFLYADPQRLLTFFDNHDMARGRYLTDGELPRLQQALTILLTARGIPQLLYGTEVGMIGGESHVELRADMPGGFPGDARSVFTESGRADDENALFEHVRTLLQLRQEHEALRRGRMIHYAPTWSNDVYTYLRRTEDETILVVVNGHDEARTADLQPLAHWFTNTMPEATDLMTGEALRLDLSEGLPIEAYGVKVVHVGSSAP